MIHKLTKATAVTLGLFILLQSPANIKEFISPFVHLDVVHSQVLTHYFHIVLYANNVINPVIYYFTLKDFREGYRKLCFGS